MEKENLFRIYLSSYDHKALDNSADKVVTIITSSGAKVNGPVPLPTKKDRFTVLRGPHVNKDSRMQYERRTHRRMIEVRETAPKSVVALSNFSLPAGVGIEIKQS